MECQNVSAVCSVPLIIYLSSFEERVSTKELKSPYLPGFQL